MHLYLSTKLKLVHFYETIIIWTRGEGGQRPPSPLVWVAGATLILSEEVV